MTHRFSAELDGARLDRLLASSISGLSRREAKRLVDRGAVFIDGQRCSISSKLIPKGARLVVHLETSKDASTLDKPIPVIYENRSIVVINKPPGVAVNKTETSARISIEELLGHVYVVHRLDRDTSGVMVLAKTKRAADLLSKSFRERTVKKVYLALCTGTEFNVGRSSPIDRPIGKDRRRPRARAVRTIAEGGKPSQTELTPLANVDRLWLMRAAPFTGRTHQIRVHLASVGAPLFGDTLYGGVEALSLGGEVVRAGRVLLHAQQLELPLAGGKRRFDAPVPKDIQAFGTYGLDLSGV